MRTASAQLRFLLRGSAAIILLTTLWWFLLTGPFLFLLRHWIQFLGPLVFGRRPCQMVVVVQPSRDWTFCIPVNAPVASMPGQAPPYKLAVRFTMPGNDVVHFTFAFPLYWAVILAAPHLSRSAQPLLAGTVAIIALESIALLVFLKINADKLMSQAYPAIYPGWLASVDQYLITLITSVLPFAAPFLLALSLHRELRLQVFGFLQ